MVHGVRNWGEISQYLGELPGIKIGVLTRFYTLSSRPRATTDHYSLGPFPLGGCFLSPPPPPPPSLSISDVEIHSNISPSFGLSYALLTPMGPLIMLKIYLPLYCPNHSLGALSLRAEVGTGRLMTLHFVQAFSFSWMTFYYPANMVSRLKFCPSSKVKPQFLSPL